MLERSAPTSLKMVRAYQLGGLLLERRNCSPMLNRLLALLGQEWQMVYLPQTQHWNLQP